MFKMINHIKIFHKVLKIKNEIFHRDLKQVEMNK